MEKVADAVEEVGSDIADAVDDAFDKKSEDETPAEKLADAMEDLGEAT